LFRCSSGIGTLIVHVRFLWVMGFLFLGIWGWRTIGRVALERQHWKDSIGRTALEGQHWEEQHWEEQHWKDRIWKISLGIRLQEREHWDKTIN
jgi:hypothetical protein